MVNRRKFFQIAGSTALAMSPVTRMLCKTDERAVRQNFNLPDYYPIEESIEDEDFWYQVRMAYTVFPNLINLN
ncbi:MAG TPA: aminotransferase, partial [Saprospiraceae bacterium]|nr:aminotransferase [Saprospiraceae bacterium]